MARRARLDRASFRPGWDDVPALVARAASIAGLPWQSGHHWLLDTFVNGHQIGHWAESLAFFHSIHLQASTYGLPPVRRLLFNKVVPPLTDHELFFYAVAVQGLGYPVETPLWYALPPGYHRPLRRDFYSRARGLLRS